MSLRKRFSLFGATHYSALNGRVSSDSITASTVILPASNAATAAEIGMSISQNLIKSGYRVVGYRRSSLAAFEKIGGIVAGSPATQITVLSSWNGLMIFSFRSSKSRR